MTTEPLCPDCKGYPDAPNLLPLYSAKTGEQAGEDWCEHDIHEPSRIERLAEEGYRADRTDLCEECKYEDHETCSLESATCPCCRDTAERMETL